MEVGFNCEVCKRVFPGISQRDRHFVTHFVRVIPEFVLPNGEGLKLSLPKLERIACPLRNCPDSFTNVVSALNHLKYEHH